MFTDFINSKIIVSLDITDIEDDEGNEFNIETSSIKQKEAFKDGINSDAYDRLKDMLEGGYLSGEFYSHQFIIDEGVEKEIIVSGWIHVDSEHCKANSHFNL